MAAETRPLLAHVVYRLDFGGLENGVVNLINNLPADRFRHAVVCLTDYTDFSRRLRPADVELVELHKRAGKDPDLYRRLWRTFRQLRPDLVHTRNLATLEAQAAAWLAGVPARVHGEHGWDMDDLHGRSRKHRLIRRAMRPLVHEYVALSGHIADYLQDQVGVARGRIHHIYNGVDTVRFRPGGDRAWAAERFGAGEHLIIGTVGRLQGVKDQAALVRAFAELRRRAPQVASAARLVIVGDGPLAGDLQALARDCGVAEHCWFAGAQDDVPSLLRGFDVFALPSLAEGISNTVLEAMACGLPVVATAVGGNPELVVADETGLLVPPGEPEALTRALEQLALAPEQRGAMGAAGVQRVAQHFSLDAMVEQYQALYERLTGGPAVAGGGGVARMTAGQGR